MTITPQATTVQIDSALQLRASVQSSNGGEFAGAVVAWASSDSAVAQVDASGNVRARRSGTTTISASSGGKMGTATVTVPARPILATILDVNGVGVAGIDTVRARDTLSVRVRVGAGSSREVSLVREGRDTAPEILASATLSGGDAEELILRAISAPSGRGRILVRVRAGTTSGESSAIPLSLSRPADVVRILAINGVPTDSLSTTAVADSFRLRVRVTTADGGQPTSHMFVVDQLQSYDVQIGRLDQGFAPGTTTDVVFTAYIVRPGSYRIAAYTGSNASRRLVFSPYYPVAVTQSDREGPVIASVSPADGSTVNTPIATIAWEMSDNRAVWTARIDVNLAHPTRNCSATQFMPMPLALDSRPRSHALRTCALLAGPNAISIVVEDVSGNRTTRPMTIYYVP